MAYNTSVTDFENVYKEYYIRLYRYAFSFLDDADASKDIVADVFSKYWKEHTIFSTKVFRDICL